MVARKELEWMISLPVKTIIFVILKLEDVK